MPKSIIRVGFVAIGHVVKPHVYVQLADMFADQLNRSRTEEREFQTWICGETDPDPVGNATRYALRNPEFGDVVGRRVVFMSNHYYSNGRTNDIIMRTPEVRFVMISGDVTLRNKIASLPVDGEDWPEGKLLIFRKADMDPELFLKIMN